MVIELGCGVHVSLNSVLVSLCFTNEIQALMAKGEPICLRHYSKTFLRET
jgi:hypothetical protein